MQANQWRNLPDMSTSRVGYGTVSINFRQLLVTGGRDHMNSDRVLSSCEYFDVSTQMWHNLAVDLPYPLMSHAVVFVGDRLLFVIGGHDEQWYCTLRDVVSLHVPIGELSNIQAGQTWESLEPMTLTRYSFACVTDGNYIYAIGGQDVVGNGNHEVGLRPSYISIERYDIEQNHWSQLPDLFSNISRLGVGSYCVAGIAGNKIFVVGGLLVGQWRTLDQFLVFNIDSQSWSRLGITFSAHTLVTSAVTWDDFFIIMAAKEVQDRSPQDFLQPIIYILLFQLHITKYSLDNRQSTIYKRLTCFPELHKTFTKFVFLL